MSLTRQALADKIFYRTIVPEEHIVGKLQIEYEIRSVGTFDALKHSDL